MASRTNNFQSKNSYFLSLAFEQAKINLGSTKTNPSVGCVVEKDGFILSSGRTSLRGRPHAEFNALKKKVNLVSTARKNFYTYINLSFNTFNTI